MKLLCDRCEFEEFATVMMSNGARACGDCMVDAIAFDRVLCFIAVALFVRVEEERFGA